MRRELRAEAVTFAFEPGCNVLNGVSAHVATGTLTGLVGPNGAGKSTLLRILCGLLKPQVGKVSLDGKALASYRPRERARAVAFLPQTVSPAFSLSVFEVVCLGRYPHAGAWGSLGPADFGVVRRCLRDTETEALAERDFMSLSGGERQRVLLASILVQEPALLLLDEPTSALDIHHEVEVFDLLARLVGDGYGVGVVTHDLNLAARYCHEMVLLAEDHTVRASGPPEHVLEAAPLTEAYGAPIRVGRHPFADTPFVSAAPRKGSW